VNSRTLAAVSVCTRTLASAGDADLPIAQSGARTIGSLRAFADRAAIRRRFHDPLIDAAHRPQNADAALLYETLTRARIDAIGVGWLAGIARNLRAHPGTDDDGVRWLAFECFTGTASPREKEALASKARTSLQPDLIESLSSLTPLVHDQASFAAAAAAWCARAVDRVPAPVTSAGDRRFHIPQRPAGSDLRRGRYAAPGTDSVRDVGDDADGNADAGPSARALADGFDAAVGYHVYSRAFDRVVNAASLAAREDLARLRLELDSDFSSMRSIVARVSKRLMRALMARQVREWQFDLEEGLLDQARLSAFVASGGAARPFKRELESPFPSTAVTLLIDHSGSMKGRPMRIAALTVEIFVRVLERCGVTSEVLGFTTQGWDGGEPGRRWAAEGYPEAPGRLNALEHIVIKAAGTPWRRARIALGLFLHGELLKENIDGEALTWAYRRLLARPERRRILVVVSDGAPMDEATSAANGFDYLDRHLAAVAQSIERLGAITLAAIGIGHNVAPFYRNATAISTIDELGPALANRLSALVGGAD
jgi:cobaltochelatase CobT